MLLTRISVPPPTQPEPEDIFASALTTIFTDDTVNSHGTPGSYVTYHSPRFGDLQLHIPTHPDVEDGRKLFAHYLWNAAVIAADAIETASRPIEQLQNSDVESNEKVTWDRRYFDLRGKATLELGAGTALPSLIAALSGASSCTITDHPSSPALTTGAIEKNVEANLYLQPPPSVEDNLENQEHQSRPKPRSDTVTNVFGHVWGHINFLPPSTDGKPAPQDTTPPHFDRIIIADCLWMPSQHINLISTILRYLQPAQSSTQLFVDNEIHASRIDHDIPCALVIAGFHTGRAIVADFFNLATESQPQAPPLSTINITPSTPPSSSQTTSPKDQDQDPATINTRSLDLSTLSDFERSVCGKLRLASIFEVDVDNIHRAWQTIREGESKWDAKRWCVVGVLVRR